MKKVDRLIGLGIDLDDLLSNAEKNKIKQDYENQYGKVEEKQVEKIENPIGKPVETPVQRNSTLWFQW